MLDDLEEFGPHWQSPLHESSNVDKVGRCSEGHLYVRFKPRFAGTPGAVYKWEGLAAEHHDLLLNADSPGRYIKILGKGELQL